MSQGQQQQQTAIIPTWHFKADYVEACNCDFGCPCNFNVLFYGIAKINLRFENGESN
jgi:hypothetical protein